MRVLVTVLVAPLTLPPETAIRDSSTDGGRIDVFVDVDRENLATAQALHREQPGDREWIAGRRIEERDDRVAVEGVHFSLLSREALH